MANDWTIDAARHTYAIPHWSDGYVDVDAAGNLLMCPRGAAGPALSLPAIVERARAEGLEVPIIPMALTGLWGSFFSRIERRGGRPAAMVRPLRRGLFNRVCLRIGPPVAANQATTQGLRATVHELGRV